MSERVGLLPGVDRDPSQGRRSVDVASWRSAFLAAVVAALSAGQAAGQERSDTPSTADTQGQKVIMPAGEISDKQLQRWVDDMDLDLFDERQAAYDAAQGKLWDAFDTEASDVEVLMKRLSVDEKGNKRWHSNEQRHRLKNLREQVDIWQTMLPGALGKKGVVRGDTALRMMGDKENLPFTAGKDVLEDLGAIDVRLDVERDDRLVNKLLARICNATKTKPVLQPNGGVRLVSAAQGEIVLASRDMLGVLERDADGRPTKVTLQMEPGRGTIIAFIDKNGCFASGLPEGYRVIPEVPKKDDPPGSDIPLEIATDGRPDWSMGFAQNSVHRTMQAFHFNRAHMVLGRYPTSETIDTGGSKTVGVQSVAMRQPERQENGEWKVLCVSQVCGDVPWPPTPCAWDVLTYTLAHANRYVAYDEEGQEMKATIATTSFNMREMTVELTMPKMPASIRVTGYQSMDIAMPELPGIPPTLPKRPRAVVPPLEPPDPFDE